MELGSYRSEFYKVFSETEPIVYAPHPKTPGRINRFINQSGETAVGSKQLVEGSYACLCFGHASDDRRYSCELKCEE